MATDHPTVRRVTTETDLPTRRPGGRLRAPALLLGYAGLWATFALVGGLVALALADLLTGVLGTALVLTVGLGAIAAAPVAARRAMTPVLDRLG